MRSDNDRDEIVIPPEEVTAFLESLREQHAEEEEWDEQSLKLLDNMHSALNDGKYYDAFVFAKKLHAHEYAKYMDEIEACYLCCAEHNVGEALAFLTERMIYRNDGRPSPEAFPFICRLADMGYIRSFIWLAECYNWGIGCDIDREKAAKHYVESIIFGNNNRAKELYKSLNPEADYPIADEKYSGIIHSIIHSGMGWLARVKLAEMIMEGKIKEYAPASAFALLMLEYNDGYYSNDGILLLLLAQCYLNGVGTEADHFKAYIALNDAEFELDGFVEYADDGFWQNSAEESLYEAKDYTVALEKARVLLKETEEKIDCPDDILMTEELEKENPRWIKRRQGKTAS